MTFPSAIRKCASGLALLCLLTSCASSPAVRTETVTVKTPVYIALPTELMRPCTVDMPNIWTNGALVEYAIHLKTCLSASNDKLMRISKLQPTASTQP